MYLPILQQFNSVSFLFLGCLLLSGSVSHPRCLPSAEAVLATVVQMMGAM